MPGAIQHMRAIRFFRGAAPSIDICGVGHFPLHDGDHAVVNVNNIYIDKRSRIFVKLGASGGAEFILECPKGRREARLAEPLPLPTDRSGRTACGRSESPVRADKSALRLPE